MKKKFLIKMFGVFVVLALVNSSVVLAKKNQKKVEQKALTNKEKEELINNSLKLNEQKFKNFNQKDYEVEGFSLKVYFKNFIPILYYEHNKTKAKIVLIPTFSQYDGVDFLKGNTFFNLPVTNEKGINHVLEHCISSPKAAELVVKNLNKCPDEMLKKTMKANAHTGNNFLYFDYSNNLFKTNEKEFKDIYDFLANPSFFKDDKLFKTEIKRILNEIKLNRSRTGPDFFIEFSALREKRKFSVLGSYEVVKNTKLEDVKELFKNYIHPSNSLTINYLDLTPKDVKKYLTILKNNYFNKFSYKKPLDLKYKLKNKKPLTLNNWTPKGDVFRIFENNHICNYFAKVNYDLEDLNIKEKFNFDLGFLEAKVKNLAKSLGYLNCYYDNGWVNDETLREKTFFIEFVGDKKELFEEKVLKENSNKILNLLKKETEKLKDEEILEKTQLRFISKKEDVWKIFADPTYFGSYSDIEMLLKYSFSKTKEPFSKDVFKIKDNNVVFSKEELTNDIKQNFKALNQLIKTGPSYIDILKKDDNLTQDVFSKYKNITINIPIKFKKCDDIFLENAAKILFSDYLALDFFKKGLGYTNVKTGYFYDGFTSQIFGDSKLRDEIFSYLKNEENFEKLISNFKVTNKDLEIFKKSYEKNVTQEVKELKNSLKKAKILKSNLEKLINGKITSFNTKEFGGLTKNSTISDLYAVIFNRQIRFAVFSRNNSFNFYKNKDLVLNNYKKTEDYDKHFLKIMDSSKKEKALKKEDYEKFIKEVLNPSVEIYSELLKMFEENLKKLDGLKGYDVKKLVKTAYLEDFSKSKKEDELFDKKGF